jgi:hypothetical protein
MKPRVMEELQVVKSKSNNKTKLMVVMKKR